ncbi:TetR/AcrR family transcriptional regulator [Nocardioides sp.]|uniref:TetR/AcrR family transcriptional regulator n=1 Tax=Nocardioides sp. TaxID=35761 RepID=UPI002ED4BDB0
MTPTTESAEQHAHQDDQRELDPRIERSTRRVRQAALDELAERGWGGFGIESVARRAGVAKSTIYRHWSGKLDLVADALEELVVQPPADPATAADARARLEELMHHLVDGMRDSTLSRCLPALIEAAEHDPGVRRLHHGFNARRRQAVVDAVRAGIDAGELDPGIDPQQAALALAGAVIYARVMTDAPLGHEHVPALVATVLGRAERE